MKTSLTSDSTDAVVARLRTANAKFQARFPGDPTRRQPVHTVYGGGNLFRAYTAAKLGVLALRTLEQDGPDPFTFARALGLPRSDELPTAPAEIAALAAALVRDEAAGGDMRRSHPAAWLAHAVRTRVRAKLEREAVEDFRIDFEDGYGHRPDAEEDGHVVAAAREVAKGLRERILPAFIGIRIKPFTEELRERSFRSLDLFLTALVAETGGKLPEAFVVTLPKVQIPEQAGALAALFDVMEPALGLAAGTLRFEVMIEQTQSILDARGDATIAAIVDASRGRCVSAHFGTYDYTASCGITALHQNMAHSSCDFAKQVMQVTLAGTGLWMSDGATNIMPVGVHRAEEGKMLTTQQVLDNRAAVHAAWRLHSEHVRRSLVAGFYQGWDLHPAQLPSRYATVYAFFLEGLDAATARLANFVAKATQATLVGDVFDDAATGQGLLNYFLRGLYCGAITESEATATGLTVAEIESRSFSKIMRDRRAAK